MNKRQETKHSVRHPRLDRGSSKENKEFPFSKLDSRFRGNDNRAIFKYVVGYVASLAFTLSAYFLARHHLATHHTFPTDAAMIVILLILAISQLYFQLVYFLHLDSESKPRWRLTVLGFAAVVLLILVLGSLWIMHNLNYNMQTPQRINQYIHTQDDL